MCDPLTIGLVVAGTASAGSAVASSIAESNVQAQQERALNMQMEQEKASAAQQSVARDDKDLQVQSQIRAAASGSGMALNSGTFMTLSNASYNKFAEDTNIANMNAQSEEARIQSEIDASRTEMHNKIISNFFNAAGSIANDFAVGAGKNKQKSGSSSNYQVPTSDQVGQESNEFNNEMDSYFKPKSEYEQYLNNSVNWG